MIEEALKYIGDQAVRANGYETLSEGRSTTTVLLPDGATMSFSKDNPPRQHAAGSLPDLIALANRFKDEGESPVVWYDRTGVRLVINDNSHRDDKVSLELKESDLFRAVTALDPRQWYEPKAFVRLLRVNLFGALDPETLLKAVKKVKFESGQATSAENARTKESLGRSITAQVTAAADLPEYVTLSTHVYTTPGVETRVGILAAVEVDPHAEKFQIVVVPDEIEKAYAAVMSSLADKLKSGLSDGIPAYQGNP